MHMGPATGSLRTMMSSPLCRWIIGTLWGSSRLLIRMILVLTLSHQEVDIGPKDTHTTPTLLSGRLLSPSNIRRLRSPHSSATPFEDPCLSSQKARLTCHRRDCSRSKLFTIHPGRRQRYRPSCPCLRDQPRFRWTTLSKSLRRLCLACHCLRPTCQKYPLLPR